MVEAEMRYEFRYEMGDLNQEGQLKPHGYLKLLNQLVEEHYGVLGLSQEKMKEHQLAWIIISSSFEILKPVAGAGKVVANTWYSGRDGISFRREFAFRDEEGDLLFHGSCFSVLMDLEERSIFRDALLPFKFLEPLEVLTVGAVPSRRIRAEFDGVETRLVRNSQIDYLGHVNNIRYGEFAYDALSEAERLALCPLARLEVYFQAELHPGDCVSILKACSGGEVLVRGVHESSGRVSFDCVMS